VLTDEISKLTSDGGTRTLIISCLTGIVAGLTSAQDVKGAFEKAMTTLAAVMRELVRTNAGIRIFVAPCTPRSTPDFATHAEFALVRKGVLSNNIPIDYLLCSLLNLCLYFRGACMTQ
jgi:hypothetical protein